MPIETNRRDIVPVLRVALELRETWLATLRDGGTAVVAMAEPPDATASQEVWDEHTWRQTLIAAAVGVAVRDLSEKEGFTLQVVHPVHSELGPDGWAIISTGNAK